MLIKYNGKELFISGAKYGKVNLSSDDIVEILNYFNTSSNNFKKESTFSEVMAEFIAGILDEDDE